MQKQWQISGFSRFRAVFSSTLLVAAMLSPGAVAEPVSGYLILGVIAASQPDHSEGGVALLKSRTKSETFAVRAGTEVEVGVRVERITRDYVYMNVHGQMERVRVGEEVTADLRNDGGTATDPKTESSRGPISGVGIERSANQVRMTTQYRENVVKSQLSKVLMQAAAVPYYSNGELIGFRLQDIDPGSVYERVGFQNGDVVTAVNGNRLTDVGLTIRMLQQMKDQPRAEVTYMRAGVETTVQIVVE